MADQQMAKIFATEEDRVNCPFYFKIGACRNGDRCNRAHGRPTRSPTLLLPHLYPHNPDTLTVSNDDDWDEDTYAKAQEHVEIFFEEVFLELANYGEIDDMVVLDNVTEHMIGNVYVKYYHEDAAERALSKLAGRFYGGKLIQAELSPVIDFREAQCRAFHEGRCGRGGLCNFMHTRHIPRAMKRRVIREMYEEHPEFKALGYQHDARSRSRSRKRKAKKGRQTSEERRAMIAEWNKELQAQQPIVPAGAEVPPDGPGGAPAA